MLRLTDIHQHIVFGIDDGARDFDHARRMLERAKKQGVGRIVCTSHITPGYTAIDAVKYSENLKMLGEYCRQNNLDIELLPGCEILYSSETPTLIENGLKPYLGASRSVLVEFLTTTTFESLCRAADALACCGCAAVFAHIERYSCLDTPEKIHTLRSVYGVKTQMNAATVISALRPFGSNLHKKLLYGDLIDVVASDAHNTTMRPCSLGDAYELIGRKISPDAADNMCVYAPENILDI